MLNRISLMGRIVRDCPLHHTQSGIPVTNFTLAVERDYKDANGDKITDFVDCVAWRQTASLLGQYGSKGRLIVTDGRLQLRDWTNRDGNKRRSAEVLIENIHFADRKPQNQNQGQYQAPPAPDYAAAGVPSGREGYGAEEAEGDLPF